jgi:pimeloyl-ACP methyl ester carboxylesterase
MLAHQEADLNGVRLHYVTAGTGRLLLFAHGFPEFWYAWKDQSAEFERDYQVVAPDLRGYNLSSKPAEVDQYKIPLLVEDLRRLADHLGHRKLYLVGHDWGGLVAWAFALIYPEYLEKLVIINAPHPAIFERELRENPAQQRASRYMLRFRSSQAEQILSANNYAALVDTVLTEGLKQGYFTDEDRRAYLEAWSRPGALTGGLNYYRAARLGPPMAEGGQDTGSLTADLPSLVVRVPTLVIWGEKDRALLPGNLVGLEQYVPDLTVKRIPDGSHWVVHEQPAQVNASLREFLAG